MENASIGYLANYIRRMYSRWFRWLASELTIMLGTWSWHWAFLGARDALPKTHDYYMQLEKEQKHKLENIGKQRNLLEKSRLIGILAQGELSEKLIVPWSGCDRLFGTVWSYGYHGNTNYLSYLK